MYKQLFDTTRLIRSAYIIKQRYTICSWPNYFFSKTITEYFPMPSKQNCRIGLPHGYTPMLYGGGPLRRIGIFRRHDISTAGRKFTTSACTSKANERPSVSDQDILCSGGKNQTEMPRNGAHIKNFQ